MDEFGQGARILPIILLMAYFLPQGFFGEENGKIIFFLILFIALVALVVNILLDIFGDALFYCLFSILVITIVIGLAFATISWIINNFWTIVWSFLLLIAVLFVWGMILEISDDLDYTSFFFFGWFLKIIGVIATIFVIIKLFRYAVIGFILFLIIGYIYDHCY